MEVERRFGLMTRRIKVFGAEQKAMARSVESAWKPLALMMAAGGLSMGFKGILGEGAEYQHQITMMRLAGRTSAEMAAAIRAANRTIMDVPTSTINDNLKMLQETTLAFGGIGHAIENLSFNQRMGSLMKSTMGDGFNEIEGFNQLVRALELRGGKLSTADYQRQASGLFRAIMVSGGTVNPENLLGFMQQAGPAARRMSEAYMTRVVPSLIQEFGGERAGTAMTAMYNQFMGRVGVGGKSITEEWVRLGLVPRAGTGGNLSKNGWTAGTLKANALAMSNPLEYVETVMFPAMRAKGINTNDANAMSLEAQKLFGRETGKRLADTLFNPQQLARIHANMKLYDRALGPDKAYGIALKNDPKLALAATAASLKNLETALGKSLMKPEVANAIVRVANGINWLAEAFDRHPNFARGVVGLLGFGAAAAGLKMFGIGLKFMFSPLRILPKMLEKFAGSRLAGMLANGLIKVGPRVMGALARFGPLILRGLILAFGLLSNPAGWVIMGAIAIAAVGAFVLKFKPQIMAALGKVKDWFMSIDWAAIGSNIAAAIGHGFSSLPSKIAGLFWNPAPAKPMATGWKFGDQAAPGAKAAPFVMRSIPSKISGKRASGGNVREGHWYEINEKGQEFFAPGQNGTIIPANNGGRASSIHVGQIVVQAANDPHETARIIQRELRKLAGGNAALYSD